MENAIAGLLYGIAIGDSVGILTFHYQTDECEYYYIPPLRYSHAVMNEFTCIPLLLLDDD